MLRPSNTGSPRSCRLLLCLFEQVQPAFPVLVEGEVCRERRHDPHPAGIAGSSSSTSASSQSSTSPVSVRPAVLKKLAGVDAADRGVRHQVGIAQLPGQPSRMLDRLEVVGLAERAGGQAEAEPAAGLQRRVVAGTRGEVDDLLVALGRGLVRERRESRGGRGLEVGERLGVLAGEVPVVGELVVATAADDLDRLGHPAVGQRLPGRAERSSSVMRTIAWENE